MAEYVLSDLHLSLGVDKPMEVFGDRWINHTEKIEKNWKKLIKDDDTVIVPGDISWGLDMSEAVPDFDFIENLPGKKIFLKGNHDLYWATQKKMDDFVSQHGYKTLTFLFNNACETENFIIAGTRGWYSDEREKVSDNAENEKIIKREVGRLKISLDKAKKLQEKILEEQGIQKEILAFLHFPAVFPGYICDEIVYTLWQYDIKRCYYGHIHANYDVPSKIEYSDISFYITSADYLNFMPMLITKKINLN